MSKKIDYTEYIEGHTVRLDVSHRGGGIEIDAGEYVGIDGAMMTAYQNYLGGGMTGSVQSSQNFTPDSDESSRKARELSDALKYYFYCLSNEEVADWDEWAASESFTDQQNRPASAY